MKTEINLGDLLFVQMLLTECMADHELGSEEYEEAKDLRQYIGELQQRLYAEKKVAVTVTLSSHK